MKIFSKKNIKFIFYLLLFVGTVLAIFQMFPHKAQFDMHYELGKPWNHELLTAPFDFPIYKLDEEITAEKDSLKRFYSPYYLISSEKLQNQLAKLAEDSTFSNDNRTKYYIKNLLQIIYTHGIMDVNVYNELTNSEVKEIFLSDTTKIWKKTSLKNIYTIRSAYDYIIKHLPLSEDDARKLNVERYLVDNLIFDKTKSESVLHDLQKNISLTAGMVQKGERIIDRGEIVKYQQFKILNSLKKEYQEHFQEKNNNWVMLGEILLITGLLFLFALYIYLFRPEFILIKNLLFFILMINLIVGSASLIINNSVQYVNIVPFALIAIVVRIFFDSRTALFMHIITVLIVSLFVQSQFLFVLLHIPAGMVAVSSLKQLTHRSQLVMGAIFIFINYSLVYLSFTLIDSGSLKNIELQQFKYFAINATLLLSAYILIWIFEKIFGYLSDVTLVELSNINNKLLMEYSQKAPGSFQHAMQVSTLATAAASTINANTLLTRTGALYHDIGKMKNPFIFTENQNGCVNPLNEKPLEEAAKMIIAHVSDGIKIAENYGLPKKVVSFIKTHHAKSVTRYFYNTAINCANGAEVDAEKFTYPGPLPATKEEAIVMMSDAVEAASHSLKEYNDDTIGCLVENIINTQIADHSFQNAPITFRDVEIVKNVLKTKLLNIYHTRISYPEVRN